ncbi:hypothetical protein [Streptomyces sp. TR02-1]|uniref:hypothetical protein n=1 Tax=Streptomyces sp. TR02-1 TaxID=3385977 RepID=UPI0039A116D9
MADIRAATIDLAAGTTADLRRRLRGQACAACGQTGPLRPGGHAYTLGRDGGRLGWPVRVCPTCPTEMQP